jgi:hypothetical protein
MKKTLSISIISAEQNQDKKPVHLLNLPREIIGLISTFLLFKDKTYLAISCKTLYAKFDENLKEDSSCCYFNINFIKNVFEAEVNQFVNLFKNNNGVFKDESLIIVEINSNLILFTEDPLVLKEGFKLVFSNLNDDQITRLFFGIINKLPQDQLVEIALIGINKISDNFKFLFFLKTIKKKLSDSQFDKVKKFSLNKYNNLLIKLKNFLSKNEYDQLCLEGISRQKLQILFC